MTTREEFEKETGLREPHTPNYSTLANYHKACMEYWKAYAKWLEKRSEWVSVEERLPEDRQTVLVFNPVSGVNQAVYRKGTGTNGFTLLAWGNRSGTWYPFVELWRPLPTPPDEAKRGRE